MNGSRVETEYTSTLDMMIDDATWQMTEQERDVFIDRLKHDPDYFSAVSRRYNAKMESSIHSNGVRNDRITYWVVGAVLLGAVLYGVLSAL